jgi:hypothetical protein
MSLPRSASLGRGRNCRTVREFGNKSSVEGRPPCSRNSADNWRASAYGCGSQDLSGPNLRRS